MARQDVTLTINKLNVQKKIVKKILTNKTIENMKTLFLSFSVMALIFTYGCKNESINKETLVKTDSISGVESEKHFIDHGFATEGDTSELKIIEKKIFSSKITDESSRYLRNDNYCWDQFYCVVNGSCYYRLTNIHPTKTIAGKVKRSWTYNHETISEEITFTLRPNEWKIFGCYYITPSQPVSFKIYSQFVKRIEKEKLSNKIKDISCNCYGGPEGSFICIDGELYRCISDPNDPEYCYYYNWGTKCNIDFFD